MKYLDRDFVIISSKRGRLTYANTRKDAAKQLKVWKASAPEGDIVYLENTTGKREYSLDGKTWSKTNPIPKEKLEWLARNANAYGVVPDLKRRYH